MKSKNQENKFWYRNLFIFQYYYAKFINLIICYVNKYKIKNIIYFTKIYSSFLFFSKVSCLINDEIEIYNWLLKLGKIYEKHKEFVPLVINTKKK